MQDFKQQQQQDDDSAAPIDSFRSCRRVVRRAGREAVGERAAVQCWLLPAACSRGTGRQSNTAETSEAATTSSLRQANSLSSLEEEEAPRGGRVAYAAKALKLERRAALPDPTSTPSTPSTCPSTSSLCSADRPTHIPSPFIGRLDPASLPSFLPPSNHSTSRLLRQSRRRRHVCESSSLCGGDDGLGEEESFGVKKQPTMQSAIPLPHCRRAHPRLDPSPHHQVRSSLTPSSPPPRYLHAPSPPSHPHLLSSFSPHSSPCSLYRLPPPPSSSSSSSSPSGPPLLRAPSRPPPPGPEGHLRARCRYRRQLASPRGFASNAWTVRGRTTGTTGPCGLQLNEFSFLPFAHPRQRSVSSVHASEPLKKKLPRQLGIGFAGVVVPRHAAASLRVLRPLVPTAATAIPAASTHCRRLAALLPAVATIGLEHQHCVAVPVRQRNLDAVTNERTNE
eukprot:GHVU01182833.1.p1 GENE.GHVU01182833.1~~GHVU01182833.1.p1  ORF type:complete len:449 (+),score=57.76 GHVU01182833.1:232-1578(+)